eukprot:TRINITY_DN17926_c0_g1_i2.p1 TRINITY_DN17926_c0_g1~~TRINITY_DN17926_c0_g1_i2.p1  ORF type:complete len:163 (+),score=23.64 TRINITY_DN17926_c0_g1_i2:180-668(+)
MCIRDRERTVKHHIGDLKPHDRNLELKVILIEKINTFMVKHVTPVTQFLAADNTGSILCNFFGDMSSQFGIGDIVYMDGAYASLFRGTLVLYTGKKGSVFRAGHFFMQYQVMPRISDKKFESKDSDSYTDITSPQYNEGTNCLLYTSPSPRDLSTSRMPSSA